MVVFLVALDESRNSKSAFFATLGMFRRERSDKIILSHVMDDLPIIAAEAPNFGIANPHLTESLDTLRKHAKTLLRRYWEVCRSFEVHPLLLITDEIPCEVVLCTSTNAGEAICKLCKDRNVDVLVTGRRGMSRCYR